MISASYTTKIENNIGTRRMLALDDQPINGKKTICMLCMTYPTSCPFCSLPENRVILRNMVGVAVRDAYPVSPGHTLLIPLRHVASFFELTMDERNELLFLLDSAKKQIEDEFGPAAYNIAINDGPAAGQTIAHMHIHLIPRYEGDVSDPRGGVRWVLPEKAKYWL